MPSPRYMIENRYSFTSAKYLVAGSAVDYQVNSPEAEFEKWVRDSLIEAHQYLYNEEFRLALQAYEKLYKCILHLAHPTLPLDPGYRYTLNKAQLKALASPMIQVTAHLLNNTPPPTDDIPPALYGDIRLPTSVHQKLSPFQSAGISVGWVQQVELDIERALKGVSSQDWSMAERRYASALEAVPSGMPALQGALQNDLAIVLEKKGERAKAIRTAQSSAGRLARAKQHDNQVKVLAVLADLQGRAGQASAKTRTLAKIKRVTAAHNLTPIIASRAVSARMELPGLDAATRSLEIQPGVRRTAGIRRPGTVVGARDLSDTHLAGEVLELLALPALDKIKVTAGKALTLFAEDGAPVKIRLAGNAQSSLQRFYTSRISSRDLGILMGHSFNHVQYVAYIPHVFFFVIPMAIGDTYAAMGDYESAEDSYASVLAYPYINRYTEVPKLWMRLADLYLEWGDLLYRQARNDVTLFNQARAKYEKIIRTSGQVPNNSLLYKDTSLVPMRGRISSIVNAGDVQTLNENPAVIQRVLKVQGRLEQIRTRLNYFGLAADYIPPFTFEHLYNLARHFGTQAQQAEQRYIQFKSQAENEEFRREQLAQQTELASATIELEQRGLTEAGAGVQSAQASVNYADVQHSNAVNAQNQFAAVRWELLELTELEAWAGAAAQDQDDEVRQTISGYSYYNVSGKRRSLVVQDLVHRRTRITHDLEASRLGREVASAAAYKAVAQAQLNQALARQQIAVQRVAIARMQHRHAQENLNFLDMKEFSEQLWYELARDARFHMRHYLDMATEVAFMMERAYDAETDRGLNLIKFDYGVHSMNDLMGANTLLADVDFFQLDYARTQSKKAPVTQTISLADNYPMAFQSLKLLGKALFETTLDQFDRCYPGQYLRKIRNVEIVFVGLTRASGISGTLRNIGVSEFRSQTGTKKNLVYPADVMPLSDYEVRRDMVIFRLDPKKLRIFENNGVATFWQLELPPDANDIDLRQILDVQLSISYDAFFDQALEQTVKAALPTSGSASRALSLLLEAPDELYYLRSQGTAELEFVSEMFPYTQEDLVITGVTLRVSGSAAPGLTLSLQTGSVASAMKVTLDNEGLADSSVNPLKKLRNKPMLDSWTVTIDPADNPGLVVDGKLDLSGIDDFNVFFEYNFKYRS
ncbi:MAG: hypothetical protein GY835_25335 [bacterium]|nr:hypothetical protein [bacterium]